jgi:hypothetical protein
MIPRDPASELDHTDLMMCLPRCGIRLRVGGWFVRASGRRAGYGDAGRSRRRAEGI